MNPLKVNNTLPAGQLVVALIGGQIAQKLAGGFQMAFVIFGVIGLIVTGVSFAIVFRNGLFRLVSMSVCQSEVI